jgi:hypothetical protein
VNSQWLVGFFDFRISAAAAEMEDLRGAVVALRLAIADLNANTELAQSAVLQLNVRESRASLAMRLQRLTPAALAMSVCSYNPTNNSLYLPDVSSDGLHLRTRSPDSEIVRLKLCHLVCSCIQRASEYAVDPVNFSPH